MAWVTVARFSELDDRIGVCVEARGKKLALFRVAGRCFAIDDACPHRNAPLHEGEVEGLEVRCPWHASHFHLETGAFRNEPADRDVTAYQVRVSDGDVQVELPPAAQKQPPAG
jgi:3-phenylpropionate/trans-cinnamate dioxygenase ferredoxin component